MRQFHRVVLRLTLLHNVDASVHLTRYLKLFHSRLRLMCAVKDEVV